MMAMSHSCHNHQTELLASENHPKTSIPVMWNPLHPLNKLKRLITLSDSGWGKGGGNQKPPNSGGPPDLDELWKDFNKKLNGLFGKKTGGNLPSSGNGGPNMPSAKAAGGVLAGALGIAFLLWLASGFYIVPEGNMAAVLRFGEWKYTNDRPGFTWRMPYPIESHEMLNVQQLRQVEVGYRSSVKNKQSKENLLLTQDQSIVDMQFAVQYRLADPKAYLFNNFVGAVPDDFVRQAAETAMRQVVGRRSIDQVLYEEKEAVAKESQKIMQSILDRYQAGVAIVDVTIQQAQPPNEVQAAFEDANKAAQDRERAINEGKAYANDVIPKAKGTSARLLEEAQGYKQRVVATAEGDASRFKSVLTEYSKAPQVTRERMYLETMQQIFANTSKVYIDSKGNGNMLYLPLEKLLQQAQGDAQRPIQPSVPSTAPAPEALKPESTETRSRDTVRTRDREVAR
jgi:modulator of FtsH protease HflK